MQTVTQENTNQIKSNTKPFVVPTPIIQKKLTIGASDDAYEIEADRVADQVVAMQDSAPLPPPTKNDNSSIQRKCTHCEEESIQKKALVDSITPLIQKSTTSNQDTSEASNEITQKINSSKGTGSLMGSTTQNFMESRFDTDFSDVRIHTDSDAAQLSKSLNAQAFTIGNDIYFNEGKYNPTSNSGKHLLAHELTHTIQQSNSNQIQKKIQVPEGTDLDTKGYTHTKTGNIYSAPTIVKDSLWNEIFTSLLASPRLFKLKGSSTKEVNENFLKHREARLGIIRFAAKKKYEFATGKAFKMNPKYWEVNIDEDSFKVKKGMDKLEAVNDVNINPKEYAVACEAATWLTFMGGTKMANIIRNISSADNDDWIPGDWGYVLNENNSTNPAEVGENIIYVGKDLFWGHLGGKNIYEPLQEWHDIVESWDGSAAIQDQRIITSVGLIE